MNFRVGGKAERFVIASLPSQDFLGQIFRVGGDITPKFIAMRCTYLQRGLEICEAKCFPDGFVGLSQVKLNVFSKFSYLVFAEFFTFI